MLNVLHALIQECLFVDTQRKDKRREGCNQTKQVEKDRRGMEG